MNEEMYAELPQFNPEWLKPDHIMSLIGRRRSGKSFTFYHILLTLAKKIRNYVVISPTEPSNRFFENTAKMMPQFIHHEFDESVIEQVMYRANLMLHSPPPGFTKDDRSAFIILEDCFNGKDPLSCQAMTDLSKNGRHLGISYCIMSQYCNDMKKGNRSQFDVVFAFYDPNESNLETVRENFFGDMDPKMWKHYVRMYLKGRGCLVAFNDDNPLDAKYFWFRAHKDCQNYPLEWHPRNTQKAFAEDFPIIQRPISCNWETQLSRGLNSLPGIEFMAKSKDKKGRKRR